jgi:hypothetical protein
MRVDQVAHDPVPGRGRARGESQWAVGIRELDVVELPTIPAARRSR